MKISDKLANIRNYQIAFVIFFLSFVSSLFFYLYFQGARHMLYGDALSRMNISRKVLDNLTPGLAQLGNVWLPLPQVLMLPFIWNDYLWHSGIAGAIVSMIAYVVGGLYMYKALKTLTNSFVSSILALSIYALNINILYLQTTAMSESLYLCFVTMGIYYFIMWIKSKSRLYLIPAAGSITAMCLVRYEGLAMLGASIVMVFFFTYYDTKKFSKAESGTILFATLASLGFAVWTLYLTAIFGDPLFWKNYYTGSHAVGDDKTQLHVFAQHLNAYQAFWKYNTAIVWMNGLIPSIMAVIALPILAYKSIKEKSFYFLPVLLSFAMYMFMFLTLQRNTPIEQPELTIAALSASNLNRFPEFNMRYGLLMLPMITLMCSYLFNVKSVALKGLLLGLLCIQFYSYYDTSYNVMYQIPISVTDNITQGNPKEKAMVKWMNQNYDDGFIMISALKHDPQMLQMGHKYRTYIHEGTGRYWRESRKDPQRYAKWVIFDSYNKDDQVTKYLKNSPNIKLFYNKVYDNDGMWVFKIKTKTDRQIKQS